MPCRDGKCGIGGSWPWLRVNPIALLLALSMCFVQQELPYSVAISSVIGIRPEELGARKAKTLR